MERVPQELEPLGGSHVPSRARGAQQSPGRRGPRGWSAVVAGGLLALAAGCIGTRPFTVLESAKENPPVHQIAAAWQPHVIYTPDPTHGGNPTPGLAGRLYLFGPEFGHPLVGDGSVVVDLYDDTVVASGGKTKMLEKWHLDKDTLKRLLRKDMIGDGYTLFLPWGTYKPEITQVHLMVSYTPAKGNPLYAPSGPLSLTNNAAPPQVASRTVMSPTVPSGPPGVPATAPPGGAQAPPANAAAAPAGQAPPSNPVPGPVPAAQQPIPQQPYYTARWSGQGTAAVNPPVAAPQPQNPLAGTSVQQASFPSPGTVPQQPGPMPPFQSPLPPVNGRPPAVPFPGSPAPVNVQPATGPVPTPAAVPQPQYPVAPAPGSPPAAGPVQGLTAQPPSPPPVGSGSAVVWAPNVAAGTPAVGPQPQYPPPAAPASQVSWPPQGAVPQPQNPPAAMSGPLVSFPAPGSCPQPPSQSPVVNGQQLNWPR